MTIYNYKDAGHDIVSKRSLQDEREHAHKLKINKEIECGVRRKGWKTPYGFGDFSDHITYEEACEHMKIMQKKFFPELFKDENT